MPAENTTTVKIDEVSFLEFIIKGLVEHKEAVRIIRSADNMGVLLTLDAEPTDMGKIIGKAGNTAKAIRTLLHVFGMKNQARVSLKINAPLHGPSPILSSTPGNMDALDNPLDE